MTSTGTTAGFSADNADGLIWVSTKSTVNSPLGTIPGAASIRSVWIDAANRVRAAMSRPNAPAIGISWIGGQPRITRTSVLGSANARTTVVWPFRIPPGVPVHLRQAYARMFANGGRNDTLETGRAISLDSVVESTLPITAWDRLTDETPAEIGSSWEPADVAPYNVAVNGPMNFWESGEASNTLTRNETRAGIVDQNPVGPDTAATTPTGLLPGVAGGLTMKGAADIVPWIGAAAVALSVAYVVSKFVSSPSPRREAPPATPRTNGVFRLSRGRRRVR